MSIDPAVSGLPQAGPLTGDEVWAIYQGGQRVETTLSAACKTRAASPGAPAIIGLPGAGLIGGGEIAALYQNGHRKVSSVAAITSTRAPFGGEPQTVSLRGALALTGGELVPLYQGGQMVLATVDQIGAYAGNTAPYPTLTANPGTKTVAANAASGTLLFAIGNVPAGVTPTVSPNDGRFAIAGDGTNGWKVVTGLSALSAGSVNVSVNAAGATAVVVPVTITAVSSGQAVWLGSDMEVDPDDSQAVGVLSGLARENSLRIIGGDVSSFVPYSAPALRGLFDYHGATSAPVSTSKSTARPSFTSGKGLYSPWAASVADMLGQVGKTADDFPEAVASMRAAIAAESRNDGIFFVLGGCGNLRDFMQSPADGISPRTGLQLLGDKFARVVIVGGRKNGGSPEYNLQTDVAAAQYVAQYCPIPIWWADDTTSAFQCGPALTQDPTLDPYRRALISAKTADNNTVTAQGKRTAYDPTAVLWGIKGDGALLGSVATTNVINNDASNTYTDASGAKDRRITQVGTAAAVNAELDRLLGVAYTPASPVLSSGSGRLWTPADLPAARRLAWFDAQDASTITQTSGVVSAWADKFGLRNALQATASRQPAYDPNALGSGIGGITFTAHRLDGAISGLAATDTLTALAIVYNTGGNTNDARVVSFASASGSDFQQSGGILLIRPSTGYAVRGFLNTTLGGDAAAAPLNTIVPIGLQAASAAKVRVGGVLSQSFTPNSADFSGIARFSIGSSVQGTTEDLKGIIGEVLLIKNATPYDIERFEGYAMQKRGVGLNLSGFSPFKVAAPRVAA